MLHVLHKSEVRRREIQLVSRSTRAQKRHRSSLPRATPMHSVSCSMQSSGPSFLLLSFRRSSKHLTGRVCLQESTNQVTRFPRGGRTKHRRLRRCECVMSHCRREVLQDTSRSHFFSFDPSCLTCEQAGFFRRYVCLLDHQYSCRSLICAIARLQP